MGRWPPWLQSLLLVGLLLLIALLVLLFRQRAPETTTITILPTPTAAVAVVPDTPPPTGTAVPPTPSPVVVVLTPTSAPTATPVVVVVTATPATQPPPARPAAPAPATKPGPSAEVRAYLDAAQGRLQQATEALRSFSEVSNRLVRDPALLDDPAWQSQMNGALTRLRATGAGLQAPGPVPEAAAPLDATLQSIGRDLVALADEYADGLAARSIPQLNAALQRVDVIGPKVEQAEAQWEALAQGG